MMGKQAGVGWTREEALPVQVQDAFQWQLSNIPPS